MKSVLGTTLAIVSMLACLAFLYCWVTANVAITRSPGGMAAVSNQMWDSLGKGDALTHQMLVYTRSQSDARHDFAGFEYMSGPFADQPRWMIVVIPYWLLVLVSGLLPAWWIWSLCVRRRRVVQGRCLACGYDMRATPGRCPECGASGTDRANLASVASSAADSRSPSSAAR